MKILALDTSTAACSVAFWEDGAVHERFDARAQHSQCILRMIEQVLAEAGVVLSGLDALAFGRGPGSFTGLRIGAGVVQGLGFAADLPVVAVSSLAALAQGEPHTRVLAALDARMNQVYWGTYERDSGNRPRLIGREVVAAARDLPIPSAAQWWGAGSGWDVYSEQILARLHDSVGGWTSSRYPHARDVAVLGAAGFAAGEAVAAEQAIPVYVRDDVARKLAER
ncbi:MAG: tRNA (adenosine(37)-N6)-threonylcarbamoyltransferase complex dimerization subunit type 1 TsaB [Acidiferrobacterales bacterium]